MALKLKGSTSGFVGLDAPAVAGNNTLILPENSGSAGQILANDITAGVTTFTSVTVNRNGDLTVPGTISIGGTLTYEDVTSVDSVGIVTARSGVRINGGGLTIIGDTTGLNVASGISTFQGISLSGNTSGLNVTGVGTFANGSISLTSGGAERLNIASPGGGHVLMKNPTAAYLAFGTNDTERLRITSGGDLLLGGHSDYTYDDTSATNVILDIYGGATAGKRGILSLSGRSGVDNATLGTIWFNNDNNSGASPGSTMKLSAAIQVSSRTSDNNAGSDAGGYLSFFTKADGGSVAEKMRLAETGSLNISSTGLELDQSTYKFQLTGNGGGEAASMAIKNQGSHPAKLHLMTGHGNWSVSNSSTVGDALEFRDEGAAATRMLIDSSGRLLVNGASSTSPDGFNHLIQVNAANHEGGITIGRHTANANGPALIFQKSRSGTATPGNGVVSDGDVLGTIRFYGSDGTDRNSFAANIGCEVDGTPGSNDMPGALIFSTTADGSATSTERMRISSQGYVTKPATPAFRAGRASSSLNVNAGDAIKFNSTSSTHKLFNQGNHYSTSTGYFTAPVADVYSFFTHVIYQGLSNGDSMIDVFHMYINNTQAGYSHKRGEYIANETGTGGYYTDTGDLTAVLLAAGDTVWVRNAIDGLTVHANPTYCTFSGFLVG